MQQAVPAEISGADQETTEGIRAVMVLWAIYLVGIAIFGALELSTGILSFTPVVVVLLTVMLALISAAVYAQRE